MVRGCIYRDLTELRNKKLLQLQGLNNWAVPAWIVIKISVSDSSASNAELIYPMNFLSTSTSLRRVLVRHSVRSCATIWWVEVCILPVREKSDKICYDVNRWNIINDPMQSNSPTRKRWSFPARSRSAIFSKHRLKKAQVKPGSLYCPIRLKNEVYRLLSGDFEHRGFFFT